MYPLCERVNEIRNLTEIDNPRKEHLLRQNMTKWLMLGSCMNTIEITEKALESFLTEETDSDSRGKIYLRISGALQILVTQQEAVKNLHNALDINIPKDSSIKEIVKNIQRIRVSATGHPTDIKIGEKEKAFGYINGRNFGPQGFELFTHYPEGDPRFQHQPEKDLRFQHEYVDIPHLIATQKDILIDVLDKVIEKLKEEEVEHRKKFASEKLTKALQITDPFFSYICEATTSTNSLHVLGVVNYVEGILNAIDEFKTGLKNREEPDDAISWRYENLDYALQHIKGCFGSGIETHINRKDAYIFANFAQQEVEALKEIAEEIDERYSQ